MKNLFIIIFLFISFFLIAQNVPQTIDYQGRLADSDGNYLNSVVTVDFLIYDAETGGALLWSETQDVSTANGIFHVLLGSLVTFPPTLFDNADRWLEVVVSGETLSPRTTIAAVPYSLKAEDAHLLNGLNSTDFMPATTDNWVDITGDTMTGELIVQSNVGIGTTTPSTELEVNGVITASGGSSTNWITAYGWGNHASAGYLTTSGTITGLVQSTTTGDSYFTGGNVGIGTTNPVAKLHINGDDGAVFIGSLNNGIIPIEGEGTRMMWYPKKAAFRAGYVFANQWDDSNIGTYSTALGCVTIASGIASTALGYHTYAEAYASVALGRYNVGGGTYSWIITEPLFEIGIGTSESNRANALTVLKSGNVGIGIADPDTKLEIAGQIKITGGNPGVGKVLTSDANGLASWDRGAYSVGDFAQGGVIFWLDETGEHGLVCAKIQSSTREYWMGTNSSFSDLGVNGDGPYSGEMNTMIIIANQGGDDDYGSYAALTCANAIITENATMYGDWYLPSKEELNLMYLNRVAINATATANGGSAFFADYYWSSTEVTQYSAFAQNLGNGYQYSRNKLTYNHYIRAIRAF